MPNEEDGSKMPGYSLPLNVTQKLPCCGRLGLTMPGSRTVALRDGSLRLGVVEWEGNKVRVRDPSDGTRREYTPDSGTPHLVVQLDHPSMLPNDACFGPSVAAAIDDERGKLAEQKTYDDARRIYAQRRRDPATAPNARFVQTLERTFTGWRNGGLALVAIAPIAADAEIFVAYGLDFWTDQLNPRWKRDLPTDEPRTCDRCGFVWRPSAVTSRSTVQQTISRCKKGEHSRGRTCAQTKPGLAQIAWEQHVTAEASAAGESSAAGQAASKSSAACRVCGLDKWGGRFLSGFAIETSDGREEWGLSNYALVWPT